MASKIAAARDADVYLGTFEVAGMSVIAHARGRTRIRRRAPAETDNARLWVAKRLPKRRLVEVVAHFAEAAWVRSISARPFDWTWGRHVRVGHRTLRLVMTSRPVNPVLDLRDLRLIISTAGSVADTVRDTLLVVNEAWKKWRSEALAEALDAALASRHERLQLADREAFADDFEAARAKILAEPNGEEEEEDGGGGDHARAAA